MKYSTLILKGNLHSYNNLFPTTNKTIKGQ